MEDSYVAVGDDAVAIMSGPDFVHGACQADASKPCPVAPFSQPAKGMVFRRVFVLGRSFAVGSEAGQTPLSRLGLCSALS